MKKKVEPEKEKIELNELQEENNNSTGFVMVETDDADKDTIKTETQLVATNKNEIDSVNSETTSITKKVKKGKLKKVDDVYKDKFNNEDFHEFYDLAVLLNISVKELKQDLLVSQLRRIMQKLAKVMVRYDVSENELERMLFLADKLNYAGVVLAPVNLDMCSKKVTKNGLEHIKVSSIIDFPFGESAFETKLCDVKNSKKIGVDEILVTIPTMMLNDENLKMYKKQCRKIGRMYKNNSSVVLNASDMDEKKIKLSLKYTNRTKLSAVTFAFGQTTLDEVKTKMNVINKFKGKKKIYVMANVDSIEGFMELNKLDTDIVLTPYADKIGDDIIERFNIDVSKLD